MISLHFIETENKKLVVVNKKLKAKNEKLTKLNERLVIEIKSFGVFVHLVRFVRLTKEHGIRHSLAWGWSKVYRRFFCDT